MPQYDYECHHCGYRFVERNTLGKRDHASCPICYGRADKIPSVANFTFGFRLAEECHHVKGQKDYFVRDV